MKVSAGSRWRARSARFGSRLAVVAGLLAGAVVAVGGSSEVAAASGSSYRALTPERILDTRTGLGATGPVGPEAAITVDVTGVGGVPDTGVEAVVLNVTAAEATASTYVTVWPTGQPKPNASNLNVLPGVDTPNSVIATVGEGGTIQLANQFGSTQLLADVSGWFPTGADYHALTPERILDTRQGLGAPGPVTEGGEIELPVTGVAGVPAAGVSAVVLNVTAAEATASTYVTVWPSGQAKPGTSNLNVRPGVDTPNLVIATVGAGGRVRLANQFGSVQLLADVAGWFEVGGGYVALTPDRVLDSRNGIGATGAVPAGGSISLQVTGAAGVPEGVSAVVLNVTAAEATTGTYVTVWPAGHPKPGTSNLNVQPGVDTPNLVIATVSADGRIELGNQFGTTHLIADVTGYFLGAAPGPVQNLSGMLWTANPQPPTVTSCLFGVDASARTRTDDLYCIDLATVTDGHDTGHYFEISQPRQELYAVEEDGDESIWLAIRPLADPGQARARVRLPHATGIQDNPTVNRQFAMSPDGKYVLDSFAIFDYSYDGDDPVLLGQDSVVALIDVAAGSWTPIAEDEYLYNPQWGADGDIIAERWNDPVTETDSTLVRIDGDALIGGSLADAPIGPSPGRLLALSNSGSHAAFAVKGPNCAADDPDRAELYVWNLVDGSPPHHVATPASEWECAGYEYGGVTAAAFSPDDSAIAFSTETFFYCGVSGCYYPQDVHVVTNHRGAPVAIAQTGDPAYQVPYQDEYGQQNVEDRGNGVWWTT